MLTPEELKIVERAKELGKTPEEAIAGVQKYRASQKVAPTTTPTSTVETPKRNFFKETAGDITETVLGIGKQIGDTFNSSMDIIENKKFNPLQKLMGVVGRIAGGASGVIGEGVVGAGKIALSQKSEDKLKEIATKVGQGVAETDVAKAVSAWYNGLNKDEKLIVDSTGGILKLTADLFGAGAIKSGAKPVISGTKNAIQTGKQALDSAGTSALNTVKPVLNNTGEIAKGTIDVGKGAYTQAKDFGKRTITNLQDTAEQARVLKTLPPTEAKLIRVGVDDASIKLIKESTPSEIDLYQRLVNKAKIKSGDLLAEQPKVVIGQEFMKPVEHLIKTKNSVGAKLGAIRQKLSNTPVDVTPYWKQFKSYLDSRGITVNSKGQFTGSGNMAKSDLMELQKMYNEIRPNNNGQVLRSQKWIDEWSQRTFKEYDLRQAREQSFSDDVTRTVEKARGIFKQALPQEYRTLSTQYSEVLKPVQEVAKLLGYKGDIDKLTTKQIKAAEVALRVIGNASDRPQAVIDSMLQVAGKYGYKSNVDLKKVIIFADALEDVYPNITPKRGFTGSTARGINQSGLGVAGDVASGNVKGVLGQVLDSTATQKEIQDALDAFLKSLTSNK